MPAEPDQGESDAAALACTAVLAAGLLASTLFAIPAANPAEAGG